MMRRQNMANKIIFLIPVLFIQAPTALVGQISLIDSLSHERPANVGESYSGRLILVNSEKDEVEIRVSQSDHLYFQDARNDQEQPGKLERSNAGWISFAKASLFIPPFSTVEVEYTVSVPDDGKIFGTYWSTILIEPVRLHHLEKEEREADDRPDEQRRKVGVKIVTHVSSSRAGELKLLYSSLFKEDTKTYLQVEIENNSPRKQTPILSAEIYTQDGQYVDRLDFNRLRIYPGNSTKFDSDLSKLARGTYKALIIGRYISAGGEQKRPQTRFLLETTAPFELSDSPWRGAGTVHGRVYDLDSRQGLPKIIVRMNEVRAVTDNRGYFEFPPIRPGTHFLTVDRLTLPLDKTTIEKNPKVITVARHAENVVEIGLTAACTLAGNVIVCDLPNNNGVEVAEINPQSDCDDLARTNDVEKDSLSIARPTAGMSNVLVQLSNGRETRRRVTDAFGHVRFDQLPKGRWVLHINKYYLPEGFHLERDSLVFDLAPQQEAQFTLRIRPALKQDPTPADLPPLLAKNTKQALGEMDARKIPRNPAKRYIVQPGDWLYAIARRLYGDARRFQAIWQANANIIMNPDLIHPGQVLKLPGALTRLAKQSDEFGERYIFALNHYYTQKYEPAISLFTKLLATNGENSLYDNCQYWIGECHFALRKYETALVEFERVLSFERSNKFDDAQIMLAFSLLRLGDNLQARAEFERLLSLYPHSEYSDIAERYVRHLSLSVNHASW